MILLVDFIGGTTETVLLVFSHDFDLLVTICCKARHQSVWLSLVLLTIRQRCICSFSLVKDSLVIFAVN